MPVVGTCSSGGVPRTPRAAAGDLLLERRVVNPNRAGWASPGQQRSKGQVSRTEAEEEEQGSRAEQAPEEEEGEGCRD